MPLDQEPGLEETSEILSKFSNPNRVYTFYKLEEKEPKYIAVDLEVTRNALQHYITDWKDLGLIEVRGKKYEYTEKGEVVREQIGELVDELADF